MTKKTELEFITFSKKDIPTKLQKAEAETYKNIRHGAIVNCSPKHGGLFSNCTNLLSMFYIVHPELAFHFNEPLLAGE